MNKKSYSLGLKVTKKGSNDVWVSADINEGFEIEVTEDFNQLEFETKKQELKDRIQEEVKKYLDAVLEKQEIDVRL